MSSIESTETWTTSDWDSRTGPPGEPVVSLAVLPDGPRYRLSDFQTGRGRAKKWILVGRRDDCDLILDKQTIPRHPWQTVNRRHCLLCRTHSGRVMVKPARGEGKNRTRVNRARLIDGKSELAPGDVLYLGKLRMMAVSQRMLDSDEPLEPNITAAKPVAFFRYARELMGTLDAVATSFKIPLRTLSRWLNGGRFQDDDND